ncbi:response regulator transcription factor [Kroppenstedtia pulmonis]|uniref:Response regulator transcription factor n=1 Tax=Kroppenstedtia pulmonis TaxID=1380685 RepID=A0A7D4CH84_9BACL|nr:response regulator transcription factor [Kroppenstedtia pulmonis]QKG85354.1 response regulator transcription factor [Kroppenstedtia pulmonis]
MDKRVLVVDDDRDIVRLVSDGLKYEQFEPLSAYSGQEALQMIRAQTVDFAILDIMMPGLDGLETCRKIRETYSIPILLLSARNRDIDKIVGLEIGADDYMTKPFSVQELIARIKAHFRRMERMEQEFRGTGSAPVPSLFVDEHTYEAYMDGKKLDLSTKEFQILNYLVCHPNRVLSREQIYKSVWGEEYGDMNTVTVHIKNLRKKMGKDFIKTIWGVGYKLIQEGKYL